MNIVFMLMILAAVLLLESFGPLAFLVWAVLIPVPDWAFQRWVRRRLATWKRYALADWSGRKRSG